jgi:hypothetical protein
MQATGLGASAGILSDPGPAQRSYQLAPAGERCLQQWTAILEGYRDGITLLQAVRKAVAETASHPRPRKAGQAVN